MPIDLAQYPQIFFEERFEGLAVIETEIFKLDLDNIDHDVINKIFRAAHSNQRGWWYVRL